MYVPPHFAENRPEVLFDLIEKNPFGILVTNGQAGLDANHLPFELNRSEGENGTLHSHVARANPVWQDVSTGDEVLVVFRAADAYIAPNWYPSKREFKKQVPTWNYLVVHAHGRVTIRDDGRYVRGLVARLTRTHEAAQADPWKMTDSPKDYIDTMLKAIVGVEIEITRLTGKFKLSQNREARDILEAGETLQKQGDELIGGSMIAFGTEKPRQS
ncbi:FMN-binding negative transcriptional regulator [Mesorhizobium sp.]|uniref:FMN-binding negative transcriptional regulator n=1 Tax=Mesorhizobium sp. TaxID=1871066 RepID=UPI000FE45E20|nr:FMN-binding negative transcriptional regulator [Mesorhizobium sp.]RWK33139.1 MAG: FMN-binding negative transcriptional regulator [Mesorhizobium sp.]RWK71318.1 MAG: FMN-binding negative transcriptional regulator [Mesorhizobium sp.]RWK77765.1 MAG: FMN-binding negative transcriptional regulator [Mesorhizobium sp.]RWK83468.1 MAG: FMN-binding negative transcriptional regulator [Mesorhizobium sp.]RWL07177.1 MAG: FMN-binding negative transcriptional regulator [Mesorhizobium sp.]